MNNTHYFYGGLSDIYEKDLKNLIILDSTEMMYPWTKASWLESYRTGNLMCIIEHCLGGNIVSCVVFSIQANDSIEIHKFLVDRSWRRTGKGRLLINKLKEEIKINTKLLKYDFLLEVSVENEEAVGFYKAIGFRVLAKRKGFTQTGKMH